MSYHRQGLGLPSFSPTTQFAESIDPYMRGRPPGGVYSPYGWGPDFNIGMPMNYTHHLDYVREPGFGRVPIPGARQGLGPMYDELSPYRTGTRLGSLIPRVRDVPFTNRGDVRYVRAAGGLGGILAVL